MFRKNCGGCKSFSIHLLGLPSKSFFLALSRSCRAFLSERLNLAVAFMKTHGRITSAEYQKLTDVSRQTASRDLDQLVVKGVASRHGARRGAYYVLKGGMPQE